MYSMRRTNHLISILILTSFLIEQASFAADLKPQAVNLFQSQKLNLSFQFPESVATIEDSWKSQDSDKTIFLLQDAHTNESGQINLSKTLDTLFKEEGDLKYIFVEAGVGDDSLSFLRKYASHEGRKQVANQYLKKGVLHGEEYLDLTSNHNFIIWGVEDLKLYQKAIDAYRSVVKDREKFQSYLAGIQMTIDTLKPRVFNSGLLSFHEKHTKFLREEISLADYFQILNQEARKRQISLLNFPDIQVLISLKEKESLIDFNKANQEQQKAIQSLPAEDQKELLEYAKKESPFKLGSNDHKEDKAFYALLEEKMAKTINQYPELSEYFAYLKVAKTLNPKKILEEQIQLEDNIFSVLAKTSDEQILLRCQRTLGFLQKLFDLKLTPDEYARYKQGSESFDIRHLTGFLNKKIMDLRNFYERAVFLEEGYDQIVKNSETFYELTKDRDEAFLKTLSEKMKQEKQAKAVLITGGFHTVNLKAIFKDNNISFVSITPQVYQETNQQRYESLLLNQKINSNLLITAPTPTISMARLAAVKNTPTHLSNIATALNFPQNELNKVTQGTRLADLNIERILKTADRASQALSGNEKEAVIAELGAALQPLASADQKDQYQFMRAVQKVVGDLLYRRYELVVPGFVVSDSPYSFAAMSHMHLVPKLPDLGVQVKDDADTGKTEIYLFGQLIASARSTTDKSSPSFPKQTLEEPLKLEVDKPKLEIIVGKLAEYIQNLTQTKQDIGVSLEEYSEIAIGNALRAMDHTQDLRYRVFIGETDMPFLLTWEKLIRDSSSTMGIVDDRISPEQFRSLLISNIKTALYSLYGLSIPGDWLENDRVISIHKDSVGQQEVSAIFLFGEQIASHNPGPGISLKRNDPNIRDRINNRFIHYLNYLTLPGQLSRSLISEAGIVIDVYDPRYRFDHRFRREISREYLELRKDGLPINDAAAYLNRRLIPPLRDARESIQRRLDYPSDVVYRTFHPPVMDGIVIQTLGDDLTLENAIEMARKSATENGDVRRVIGLGSQEQAAEAASKEYHGTIGQIRRLNFGEILFEAEILGRIIDGFRYEYRGMDSRFKVILVTNTNDKLFSASSIFVYPINAGSRMASENEARRKLDGYQARLQSSSDPHQARDLLLVEMTEYQNRLTREWPRPRTPWQERLLQDLSDFVSSATKPKQSTPPVIVNPQFEDPTIAVEAFLRILRPRTDLSLIPSHVPMSDTIIRTYWNELNALAIRHKYAGLSSMLSAVERALSPIRLRKSDPEIQQALELEMEKRQPALDAWQVFNQSMQAYVLHQSAFARHNIENPNIYPDFKRRVLRIASERKSLPDKTIRISVFAPGFFQEPIEFYLMAVEELRRNGYSPEEYPIEINVFDRNSEIKLFEKIQQNEIYYGPSDLHNLQKLVGSTVKIEEYFDKTPRGFRLKKEIRRIFSVRELNLESIAESSQSIAELHPQDFIILMNVYDYLDHSKLTGIFNGLVALLGEKGTLYSDSHPDSRNGRGRNIFRKEGARLALDEPVLQTLDSPDLTLFALHIADIHTEEDLNKPIALSLDDNHQPTFFKVVKKRSKEGTVQVSLLVLTAPGDYQTIKIIPNAKEALARIRDLSPAEYSKAYTRSIHILLATAASQTDMAIDAQKGRGSLEHALPTGSLALIEDASIFEAQAQILVEGLLRIGRLREFEKDVFYLTGNFNIAQKVVFETLIKTNGLASMVHLGEPQGKSAIVRYIDTARITGAPTPRTGEIQFPVTGFEKDQVLGWYSVIREAGSVGGVYAAHFNGKEILFDQVEADALPVRAFMFHNAHALKRLSNLLHWKNVLEGRVALEDFKDASFYMPLGNISIELLVQGARMALKSIDGSA